MFRYFGPFTILAQVGVVAYKLDLPERYRVHPMLHVSLLKRHLKPDQQVLPALPCPGACVQVPVRVMDRRIISPGEKSVTQVLVKWIRSIEALLTSKISSC